MNIKRFVLINSMALSLLGASIASAETAASNASTTIKQTGHYRQHVGKMLTPTQRA
ncbi:MAG: hypothetical protein ACRCXC_05740 [Legionella sp.]